MAQCSTVASSLPSLPPEAWPPTSWFESWALGSNLFDVPTGSSPFELRWLLCQRQ